MNSTPDTKALDKNRSNTKTLNYNLLFATLGALAFLIIATTYYQSSSFNNLKRERNEYSYIAESLARGYGFSNPFGSCSLEEHEYLCFPPNGKNIESKPVVVNPTAWMPPAYPAILGLIFIIFGIKSKLSFLAVLALKTIGFSTVIYCVQKILFKEKQVLADRSVAFIIFILMVWLSKAEILDQLHDIWIIAPLVTLLTAFLIDAFQKDFSNRSKFYLCLLAILLPLATATLGFAFLVLGSICSLTARQVNRRALRLGVLISMLTLGAWCTRNILVFEKLVLNKSNLWYDFYQAQVIDDDGIVSYSTFQLHHPIIAHGTHMEYVQKGEVRFMEKYKQLSFAYLRDNLWSDYIVRAIRRFFNTIIVTPTADTFDITESIDSTDLNKLETLKLVTYIPHTNRYRWVNVKDPIKPKTLLINNLFPDYTARLVNHSLEQARISYLDRRNSAKSVWQRRLMGAIPSLCILICMLWKRTRSQIAFRITLAVYGMYFIPYILVSHYQRYQIGPMGLHLLFIMFVYLAIRETYKKDGTTGKSVAL